MSVAELKQAVEGLTDEERLELAEYLRWRARRDDPAWQAELGRRLDHSLGGASVPASDLYSLNDRLKSEGK